MMTLSCRWRLGGDANASEFLALILMKTQMSVSMPISTAIKTCPFQDGVAFEASRRAASALLLSNVDERFARRAYLYRFIQR